MLKLLLVLVIGYVLLSVYEMREAKREHSLDELIARIEREMACN